MGQSEKEEMGMKSFISAGVAMASVHERNLKDQAIMTVGKVVDGHLLPSAMVSVSGGSVGLSHVLMLDSRSAENTSKVLINPESPEYYIDSFCVAKMVQHDVYVRCSTIMGNCRSKPIPVVVLSFSLNGTGDNEASVILMPEEAQELGHNIARACDM